MGFFDVFSSSNGELKDNEFYLRATFEIIGSPEDHVKKAMQLYLDNLEKSGICVIKQKFIDEPEKQQDKLFSVVAEIEAVIKRDKLGDFITVYMPSYVEVIEPAKMNIHASDLTSWLNALINKLHAVDLSYKNVSAELVYLREKFETLNKNTLALLKNFLKSLLNQKSMSLEELSSKMGIQPNDLEKILIQFVREKFLKKSHGKYMLAKS